MSTSKMAEKPRTSSTRMIVAIITTAMTTTMMPEQLADPVELLLQRRGLVRRLLQHAGDAPHLGLHPRRRDHRAPAPVSRRRAAEDHVVTVAEPRLSSDRGDILRHRQALACQRRLRRLQRGGLDQPRVGGNGVAFFDEDDVAGYEFCRRNALSAAVANDIGVRRRHLAQRRHGLLRAGLLEVAHERVEQHDGEDRDGLVGQGGVALVQPQPSGNQCRDDQQDDEHVRELGEKLPPCGDAAFPPPARSCRNVEPFLRPTLAQAGSSSVSSAARTSSTACR